MEKGKGNMQKVNRTKEGELISTVIPVYNAEAYLKNCLDSIISQTYSDFEAIVINDGSTDNSLGICKQYTIRDKRIILINQNNSGVSRARNAGLSKAKGEYIIKFLQLKLLKRQMKLFFKIFHYTRILFGILLQ